MAPFLIRRLGVGRIGLLAAVAALGLVAMGGSALAASSYTAYGQTYKMKTINGVDVAVADDGTVIWSSVADTDVSPDAELPTDETPVVPDTDIPTA